MTRIEKTFAKLQSEGRKAFIPYITSGDPPKTTYRYVIPDALGIGSCDGEVGGSARAQCYLTEGPVLALSLAFAALAWPIALLAITRREKTRRAKWIRLVVELLLIGGPQRQEAIDPDAQG